ncbi:hypothetical protein LCGC14_1175760 [marine sediment metagenome]|uniref:DUF559 domain-containing protein n=1 Tax=marine sediment metagenome TaxID=412755 RepID=A0A0F9P6L5_9ZZZZ
MGTRRKRKRNRSHLTIPKNAKEALLIFASKSVPVPKLGRRPPKGERIRQGTRLRQHGYTPEESLMLLAPDGSKPERIIYGWLVRHQVPFEYQVPLMGGRVPGGAIIDFKLNIRFPAILIRVQSYWHTKIGRIIKDELQLQALQNLGYDVRDVWDYEVSTEAKVHTVMTHLIYGPPRRAVRSPSPAQPSGFNAVVALWR